MPRADRRLIVSLKYDRFTRQSSRWANEAADCRANSRRPSGGRHRPEMGRCGWQMTMAIKWPIAMMRMKSGNVAGI
jgi:hypothetical protein